MAKFKAIKNPDGSYHYRGHYIKKGKWSGRHRSSKPIWSYQDAKTGLWRTSPTLKQCKAMIDKFIEFYVAKEEEKRNDREHKSSFSKKNEA